MSWSDGLSMGNGATKTLTTSPDERGMVHRVIVEDDVIARGKRKYVCPARLLGSWRGGDKVVIKVLEESVPDEEYWQEEIAKCRKLREYVIAYRKTVNMPVKVHVEHPMTAYIDKVSKWMSRKMKLKVGEFVLVEETLGEKYAVFMTSFGRVDSQAPREVEEVLSELMHFTYHDSCRKEVFCGFQGSFSDGLLSLAEPTIHSVDQRYRDNDMGLEGILIAFDNHMCTIRCKDWMKPEGSIPKIPVETNMVPIGFAPMVTHGLTPMDPPKSAHSVPNGSTPKIPNESKSKIPNGSTPTITNGPSKIPNGISIGNGHKMSNHFVVPNGYGNPNDLKVANGQRVGNGYKVSNGHKVANGHMTGNGYTYRYASDSVIGSISTTV